MKLCDQITLNASTDIEDLQNICTVSASLLCKINSIPLTTDLVNVTSELITSSFLLEYFHFAIKISNKKARKDIDQPHLSRLIRMNYECS